LTGADRARDDGNIAKPSIVHRHNTNHKDSSILDQRGKQFRGKRDTIVLTEILQASSAISK